MKRLTIVFLAACLLLICVGSVESQLMRARDSTGRTRIILVTSEGKLILSSVDTLLSQGVKLTVFPNDSLVVTATLDSLTYTGTDSALVGVSMTAVDADMYVWVNSSSGTGFLLERSAVLTYKRWNEITKIYAQRKTENGVLWVAGSR